MMRFILTLLFVSLYISTVKAQATASFTASATIIQPIGLKTLSHLNFAEIDARGGGEVKLTPAEERIATGDTELENGAAVTAAAFEVTGQSGFTYSLTLPSGIYSMSNGREQMLIKNFSSSIGNEGNLASGKSSFKVGATLVVAKNQAPGLYSTSTPLNITVNYN